MTCNHIANIFLTPGTLLFEVMIDIGYFTAITMCYFLVEGYGYTHDKKKYGERLLLFGVISFIPFCLAFGMVQMNMLCTLFLCFLILKVMEMSTLKWEKWIVILILIFVSLYSDWALLAPVFTILFAKSKGNRIKTAISFGIGACLFAGFNYLSNLESMNTGSALIHALCSGIGPVVAESSFYSATMERNLIMQGKRQNGFFTYTIRRIFFSCGQYISFSCCREV